jgi:hypothetical protein
MYDQYVYCAYICIIYIYMLCMYSCWYCTQTNVKVHSTRWRLQESAEIISACARIASSLGLSMETPTLSRRLGTSWNILEHYHILYMITLPCRFWIWFNYWEKRAARRWDNIYLEDPRSLWSLFWRPWDIPEKMVPRGTCQAWWSSCTFGFFVPEMNFEHLWTIMCFQDLSRSFKAFGRKMS